MKVIKQSTTNGMYALDDFYTNYPFLD